MQWPLYFSDQLSVGRKESAIGIVTLWTKKEVVTQHLSPLHYAIVGQLYSRYEGLNALIRNCLANKHIRHIVIVGVDLNKSAEALLAFFANGVDEDHHIIGISDVEIDPIIALESLNTFRHHVTIHDWRHIKDYTLLSKLLASLEQLPSYGDPEIFPTIPPPQPAIFPSEKNGFVIHEDFIGPAWLRILSLISHFGCIKKSQYGGEQRELLNIMVVIDKEDPDVPKFHNYFQFTQEDLFHYYPQIITANTIEGIEYSYGQRLRGRKEGDQIQHIIRLLQKTLYTRRAIAVTWNIQEDMDSAKPPCLILTQFLVQDEFIYLTAFFRSNDIFHAWPRNAFGLRKLQYVVAEILGLSVGSLTIHSSSAHIYQRNWDATTHILEKHTISAKHMGDPRGNIIIRVAEGNITITHTNPNGKVLDQISGKDIPILLKWLVLKHRLGELSHALYIGTELQKATIALNRGIPYTQDRPLEFT